MPIIHKKDLNNWYNQIPATGMASPWEHLSADRLKGNEIPCGSVTLAKIPKIPGRITFRNRKNGNYVTRYVEFVLERVWDREKHQSRNRRIIIGIDVSHIYSGMMIINDKYHQFFDTQGRMIYVPPRPEPEETAELPEKPEAVQTERSRPEESPPDTSDAGLPDDESDAAPDEGEESVNDQDLRETQENEEDPELQASIRENRRRNDRLEFLNDLLLQYKDTIDEQAKRRPDKLLSLYQIRRTNELLGELKSFFSGCDTEEYLRLAEEPDEAKGIPGMTYADMALLLSSYYCTLFSYRMGRLWGTNQTKTE